MKRLIIAKYIATAATVLSVIGIIFTVMNMASIGDYFVIAGVFLGMISYLFGGLLTALKMAGKIAVTGWFIIPIFPIDLMFLLCSFAFATNVFIFAPIIPINKAYKESMAAIG